MSLAWSEGRKRSQERAEVWSVPPPFLLLAERDQSMAVRRSVDYSLEQIVEHLRSWLRESLPGSSRALR